jgi:iron-sulfur cluster repair protein YtfE (RIC family)
MLLLLVLEERNAEGKWYFSGPNLTDGLRESFAKWRAGLEQRTGKLIFPMLMKGDANAIRDLAKTVERMEALNADHAPKVDSLRLALLKLIRHRASPLCVTWNDLEKQLAELRAGNHAREHIHRVMKQLGIWGKLIQIIPAKRGPRVR